VCRWPSYKCGEGLQEELAPWAGVFLFLYGVGVPATCVRLIWLKRDLVRKDQERRRRGVGWNRTGDDDRTYELRKRYHKVGTRPPPCDVQSHRLRSYSPPLPTQVYYLYEPDYCWWMAVTCAFKLALAFVSITFNRHPLAQVRRPFFCFVAACR
jgi:hypothetical protein